MKTYSVAVLAGDGVGPEIIAEGLKVLKEAQKLVAGFQLDFTHMEAGGALYARTGIALPAEVWDFCEKKADAIYLGAMGLPTVVAPDGGDPGGQVNLRLRAELELFYSLRLAKLYPGVPSPLAGKKAGDIDYAVFRELSEGLYASHTGGLVVRNEIAIDNLVMTRKGVERVVHAAFMYARTNGAAPKDGKKRVTCVDKSNVLKSLVFFRRIYNEIAEQYPDVEKDYAYVDASTVYLIQNPEHYHVLVMENMFGDIVSDMSAATVGGLGMSPSADIGTDHAIFQPVHGSAPTIAGKAIANPLATILSGSMMLDWLGKRFEDASLKRAARLIDKAVEDTLATGMVRTADIGGKASTTEMGDAVVKQLQKLAG